MKLNDSIDLAIENVLKEGVTDVEVFTRPFELDLLKIPGVAKEVKASIKSALNTTAIRDMGFNPISHILAPKKEFFDFRKCAIIQLLDELKFLSLVLQVAQAIEIGRVNKSKNIVFSYRFKPDGGYLFDSKYGFTAFRQHVSKKSKQKNINVVVSCDISNFYDRINLHRLECILASSDRIDKKIVSQINELLLFWSNRDSYGLPVGSNASRILAEAALIEVDNYLLSHKISYCRFVDDFRLFAPDAATAHRWLAMLVDKLAKEGLFLNTSKTAIKDVSQFLEPLSPEENSPENTDTEDLSAPSETLLPLIESDEKIDPVKTEIGKIIRGYSGLIPTKFRALTDTEQKTLLNKDISELISLITDNILIEPKTITLTTKVSVAQANPASLITLMGNLRKFPQFIPYVIDAATKHEAMFTNEHVLQIHEILKPWLKRETAPEFVSIYVAKFFGTSKFSSKEILFEYFRNLKRNDGNYIGRSILEHLESLVTRSEVLEIRDYYTRADSLEKRQIAKMVDRHLTEGEKRPFFKNALSQTQDLFLKHIHGFHKLGATN